ncbi:hypothetical protein [Lysinibacillus boronitolerans]|uniref:hypothetical protein n=1 Tax=Lysinibacillus TaxID=400634 RepID=UPI002867F937|nr:hypothetical protein [Lysinibacillus boronitolerans]
MEIKLFEEEIDDLVHLLTQNRWLYHTNSYLKEEAIRAAYAEGDYQNNRETHWILEDGDKVGLSLFMI